MTPDIVDKIVELYPNSLLTFGYFDLPKFYQPKRFVDRVDRNLIDLCRVCNKMDTLVSDTVFAVYIQFTNCT